MAVVFSNQARFGGSFSLSPEAANDDGLVDYGVMPDPANSLREAGLVLRTALGRGAVLPSVARGRVANAWIEIDRDAPFFGDGEILTCGRDFSIVVRPRALRIVVPAKPASEENETCVPAGSWS